MKASNCIICGKVFKFNPNSSKGKYCSYFCYWKNLKGKKPVHLSNKKGICMNTGRTHFKKGQIAWNKGKHIFLGGGAKKGNTREKSPSWKGGITKSRGYILIHSPNHPFKDAHNYVRQSHLVMEKILGRYIQPHERVHHINGIKDDDRPENLKYFPNESKHQKFHHPKGKCCCL